MGLSDSFEYRFNFFIQVFSWYFPLIIQLLLWKAIYRSTGESEVAGYSFNMIFVYYVTVMIINELIKTEGIEWSIVGDIRDGGLQKYLLKPLNYILYQFIYILSKKVVVLICIFVNLLPIGIVFSQYYDISYSMSSILLFIVTLFCSLIIMFLLHAIIAMCSFWFTEFVAIFNFLPFGISLLNGTTLPLNIFPDWFSNILRCTPFYYMVYFPSQVLNGQVSGNELSVGFVIQFVWIIIGIGICKTVWGKGIKHFSATGG